MSLLFNGRSHTCVFPEAVAVYMLLLILGISALATALCLLKLAKERVKLYRMGIVVVFSGSPVLPEASLPSFCALFGDQAASSAAPSLFAVFG